MKRAAVVIGVDKTGKLTPLSSAATGAERVASWLKGEGFDVACLTDKGGPLECAAIEKAVEKFVTVPPRYHLLVVYFSGHGYWQARSDVWLLSGAPVKVNEAVNLEATMDLAKYSGIPNVVFVSDACRSIPDSRTGAHIDGRGVFPNYDEIDSASKIDYFKATSDARPAYEGKIDGTAQSVLTAALMAAFVEPDAPMVRVVKEGGKDIEVVPNRRLEDFLQRTVDALLERIDPNATQRIEVNVPSSEDVYIARVRRAAKAAAPMPPPPPPAAAPGAAAPSPRPPAAPKPAKPRPADAPAAPAPVGADVGAAAGADAGAPSAGRDDRLERKVNARMPHGTVDHFETETGFVIHGAMVTRAVASQAQPPLLAKVLRPGDGKAEFGVVRVEHKVRFRVERGDVASVGVQLADGRAVVLALLPGFLGHAAFDEDGMTNVSYIPSSNNWRWGDYQRRRQEIDRFRAMVAVSVDNKTFRVRSEQEANALAERIRMYKGVEPTLGLYAAYAYSQAGNEAAVASVLQYLGDDLGADLFDVRVLASRSKAVRARNVRFTPFCPMLTQTWNLLRTRRVDLPPVLQRASGWLCNSLWTTFEPEAGDDVIEAMLRGELR
jgi:hypothetical protein